MAVQPAPPPPASQSSRDTPQPTAAPRPDPETAIPRPAEDGAIFRALVEAGAEAMVAYTAEKRLHTMLSEAVASQLQPFIAEMRRRFDEIDRRLDEHDRRLDALSATVAEHDRKLEVIVARLDGMRVLGQVILGALGLLITALIAVFGLLFTS